MTRIGGPNQTGITSVDKMRDLPTRNWTNRVVWGNTVLVVPVTWDSNVADFVDLLCVQNVHKTSTLFTLGPNVIST